jgi:hypothetical protein
VDDPRRYFDVRFAEILDEMAKERSGVNVDAELSELAFTCNLRGEHDKNFVLLAAARSTDFIAEVATSARKHLRQLDEQLQQEHPEHVVFGDVPDGYGERKHDGQLLRQHIDGMLDAFDLMHPETPGEFAKHLLGFMMQTSLPGVPRRDATPEAIEDARKRVAKGVRKAFNRAEYDRPTASSVGVSVLRELGVSKDIAKSVFRK